MFTALKKKLKSLEASIMKKDGPLMKTLTSLRDKWMKMKKKTRSETTHTTNVLADIHVPYTTPYVVESSSSTHLSRHSSSSSSHHSNDHDDSAGNEGNGGDGGDGGILNGINFESLIAAYQTALDWCSSVDVGAGVSAGVSAVGEGAVKSLELLWECIKSIFEVLGGLFCGCM